MVRTSSFKLFNKHGDYCNHEIEITCLCHYCRRIFPECQITNFKDYDYISCMFCKPDDERPSKFTKAFMRMLDKK